MSAPNIPETARQKFKPLLAWSQAIEMADLFGVTKSAFRSMVDAKLYKAADIPGRNKWPREPLIALLEKGLTTEKPTTTTTNIQPTAA